MEILEGLDDRALALDGANLQILRWGAEENRVPLVNLEPSELVRNDKKKLFGANEERCRLRFGAVITAIWLPVERQAEAEAFAAKVDAAREAQA
jgi:23S rRNA A2030 N6-methylase RlmJ